MLFQMNRVSCHLLVLLTLISAKRPNKDPPVGMSRSEVLSYFTSVLRSKMSTFDKLNEDIYSGDTFPEDLYHHIDHLMPHEAFMSYLLRTKNITDRNGPKGYSIVQEYPGELNIKCHPDTIFPHSASEALILWDSDRTKVTADLEKYYANNAETPHTQICNRFRGLTCQLKKALNPKVDHGASFGPTIDPTCQCDGDGKDVGFFPGKSKAHLVSSEEPFPAGCYIRPWRSCSHISLDYVFRNNYYEAHTNVKNQNSLLVQLALPVARTHRCKEGTYCLDLIPGMNKPTCWCNGNSRDDDCKVAMNNTKPKVIPLGSELASIRRNFAKLFIPVDDSRAHCIPRLNEIVEKIVNVSGEDPSTSGVVLLMKEVLSQAGSKVSLCDFRQSLYCDPATKKCIGRWFCEPGKVHLEMGKCAIDNGFPCQSSEECVEKAKCKKQEGTTEAVCVCETGHGSKCEIEHSPFFGKTFLSVISGFKGEEYLNLQTSIYQTLELWEGSMNSDVEEICDPDNEEPSMEIVNYFGNLVAYDKVLGEKLLAYAKVIIKNRTRLCRYNKFLRCDKGRRRCVPIIGTTISFLSPTTSDRRHIVVEVKPGEDCGIMKMPKIFHSLVRIDCSAGYICKKDDNREACRPDCTSSFAPKEPCSLEGTRRKRNGTLDEFPDEEIKSNKRRHDKDSIEVMPGYELPSETTTEAPTTEALPSTEGNPRQLTDETTTLPSLNRQYGESCEHNGTLDPASLSDVTACDNHKFLYCNQRTKICLCYPPLVHSDVHLTCMTPVGYRCEESQLKLPTFMIYENVKCEFGMCINDSGSDRRICRPSDDRMLILVPIEHAQRYYASKSKSS